MDILKYSEFNEGLFSKEYDSFAKTTFNLLLDNISDLDVIKHSDNKREVTITKEKKNDSNKDSDKDEYDKDDYKENDYKENDKNSEELIDTFPVDGDERNEAVQGLKKKGTSLPGKYVPPKSLKSRMNLPLDKNVVKIEVFKNNSKHRFTTKSLLPLKSENSYSLAINGKHFVDENRGKVGVNLVSEKIIKRYWDLLDQVWKLKDDKRRNIISDSQFNESISKLKKRFS